VAIHFLSRVRLLANRFVLPQTSLLSFPKNIGSVLSYLSVRAQSHRSSHALIMSSLSIVAMFSLANGRHEQVSSAQVKSTTYIVYDSSISCPDQTGVDVQIHHFSPNILPDNTVALVICKVAFPLSTTASPSPFAGLLWAIWGKSCRSARRVQANMPRRPKRLKKRCDRRVYQVVSSLASLPNRSPPTTYPKR